MAAEGALSALPESPLRLNGLPPLIAPTCRVLILGSFPGVASLAAQQYYGHPRNQFWPIMLAILPSSALVTCMIGYQKRSEWLLENGIGLWDVYAACERQGSLDADIRHALVNDFSGLRQRYPQLQAIAHNGLESYKHHRRIEESGQALGVSLYKLPSSSPANASWTFERKLNAWRDALQPHLGF